MVPSASSYPDYGDDYDSDEFDSDEDFDSEEDDIDDAFGDYLVAAMHAQTEELRSNQRQVAALLGVRSGSIGPPPEKLFNDYLEELSQSHMLKLTNDCVKKFGLAPGRTDLTDLLVSRIHSGITHFIVEDVVLELVSHDVLFPSCSHLRLSYLKLISKQPLPCSTLLSALRPTLTELEIHNIEAGEDSEVMVDAISQMSGLKQLNLFGLTCPDLDALLETLAQSPSLDELRIRGSRETQLSSRALQNLLNYKPKWWRLGFERLGLVDRHCEILASALSRPDSKVGDLLSLEDNPNISQSGYKTLFRVCYQKSRMGLIRVDEKKWEREFDLVRSLNNLRGRLDVIAEDGSIRDHTAWVEFLHKVGNQGWEADTKKVNYVWFMVRQNAEMMDATYDRGS